MGMTVERTGFIGCRDLFNSIIEDLIAGGFSLIHPAAIVAGSTSSATLETTNAVNALHATQPWRLRLDCTDDLFARAYAGTELQLLNDGTVTTLAPSDSAVTTDPESAGVMGQDSIASGSSTYDVTAMFIERRLGMGNNQGITLGSQGSYPMSYRLTVTDRGVALFVWTQSMDNKATDFSWFAIQRPVDHLTGVALVTGKCPVFCVYSAGNLIRRFVVREADIQRPTKSVSATLASDDVAPIINDQIQVAINEEARYVIRFPNNLNTQRYAYTQELDMIAFTSADVVSEFTEVPVRPYGETVDRKYIAMKANKPNNTGVRILQMIDGPGIA